MKQDFSSVNSTNVECLQCANLDERCFCPQCRYSWYGRVSKCPACRQTNGIIVCYTTIEDCLKHSSYYEEIECNIHLDV